MKMSVLKTERLVLRPFVMSDVGGAMDWLTDKKVAWYCLWQAHTRYEQTERLIEYYVLKERDGFEYRWAITLAGDDRPIGEIEAYQASELLGTCSLRFNLSRKHWNNGYMTEALRAVTDYMHSKGFNAFDISVHVEDKASHRLAEKLGMKWRGVKEEEWNRNGTQMVMYEVYQLKLSGDEDE